MCSMLSFCMRRMQVELKRQIDDNTGWLLAHLEYSEEDGEGGFHEGAQRLPILLVLELVLAREDAQSKERPIQPLLLLCSISQIQIQHTSAGAAESY